MFKLWTITIALLLVMASVAAAQNQTVTFNLMWTDNSTGAAQEDLTNIERGPAIAGPFQAVGQVQRDVTAFTDVIQNDPGGVQRCYRLQAVNKAGVSAYGNVACATSPSVQIAPGTPGNISVTVTVTVESK
jgi:hypothetical protein